MKIRIKSHVAVVMFFASSLQAEKTQGYSEKRVSDSIAVPATANRNYRLLVPSDLGKTGEKFPLVICLHGAGAKGSDNLKQVKGEVLPAMLAKPEMREKFPCFVLVPQCRDGEDAQGRPNNWVKWVGQKGTPPAQWVETEAEPSDQLRAAMAALDDVLATQPVDLTRIYLTGVSMGGSASWYWAAHEPERFAAVVTACGLSEEKRAEEIARIPLWAFHGSRDPIAPVERTRAMVEALRQAGSAVKFTEFDDGGHGIAQEVFEKDDHAVVRWMFAQRRSPQ